MDQVSRPLQVVLVIVLAFGALWLIALRPASDSPEPPAPAPPAAQPGSAIPGAPGDALDKARAGAGKANSDNAARSGRVDSAAAGRGSGSPASPGSGASRTASPTTPGGVDVTGGRVPRGDSPAAVNRALERGRTVVVLFHGSGSDDAAVRGELSGVNRRGGRVAVFRASIADVSRFTAVTRGVRVLESPTVVVAGPAGKGRALFGYTHATEIDQAVNSVLPRR